MACLRSRLVAALLLVLPACAEVPTEPAARAAYDEADDPFEPLNREFFSFTMFRDGMGMGADSLISPYGFILDPGPANWFGFSRFVVDGVDKRAQVLDQLDQIERSSIDFYAQIRSLSRQKREEELYHGNPPTPKMDQDLYNDPAKP